MSQKYAVVGFLKSLGYPDEDNGYEVSLLNDISTTSEKKIDTLWNTLRKTPSEKYILKLVKLNYLK